MFATDITDKSNLIFMNIKKYLFLTLAAIVALVGCRKEPLNNTLTVDPVGIYFSAVESSQVVTVNTDADFWTATANVDWITIIPANDGKTFLLKATENSGAPGQTASARTGSVTVTAGKTNVTINVQQGDESVVFLVLGDTRPAEFPSEGGQLSIQVTHNIDYVISGTNAWLTQNQTKATVDDNLTFTIAPNETSEAREAVLSFRSTDGVTKNVTVTQSKKAIAEYTIMFYGCGGTTLDYWTGYGLFRPLMKGGSNDDINITFLYKYSKKFQPGQSSSEGFKFDGARRWYAPKEGTFKWDTALDADYSQKQDNWVVSATAYFEPYSEKVGDASFDLANPKNLTDFIDWNIEKYPAKKYVLVMKNHGGGWDYYDDGIVSTETKSQLNDDNTKTALKLPDVVKGIKDSKNHKVDAIISDECLMATMEILNEYATVADYNMAAFESTVSLDGDYLLKAFKDGAKKQSLFDILKVCVNDYANYAAVGGYTDQGVYDLSKIGSLNAAVKSFAEFLVNKDKEGDINWIQVRTEAVRKTVAAMELDDYNDNTFRETVLAWREYLEEDSEWETLTEAKKKEIVDYILWVNERYNFECCLYDYMYNVVAEAAAFEFATDKDKFEKETAQLKGFVSAYDKALRDMAYINCTFKHNEDEPYRFTSPGVQLRSLKKGIYGPIDLSHPFGYYYATAIPLSNAISIYSDLNFDKATGWGAFLQTMTNSATPFVNPDRKYIDEGK